MFPADFADPADKFLTIKKSAQSAKSAREKNTKYFNLKQIKPKTKFLYLISI
ncbi:hypothetical protein RC62_2477 [Flavobacterium aquidurense]|uniref:Uncharacterized protein n=1 Tax=Flavobacterium aquidurense TaxID=362413 RepID=A0A0Q0XNI3_9FLAO|nr:hypothetical protein RC62_2477 [Flavobacterium aquidurense]